jgi:TPP-dependent pyruvate/acetoin dehydrogenase alpha subunit
MENNSVSPAERKGRGSPTSEHSAAALSDVPRAYGLATEVIDGTDLDQVVAACRRATDAARTGNGPYFIESRTSRWPGNYGSSPTLSVGGQTDIAWAWAPESAPAAIRRWTELSDPVLLLARRLLAEGAIDRATLLEVDDSVRLEISAAVEFAVGSPEPSPDELMRFVFAPPLAHGAEVR